MGGVQRAADWCSEREFQGFVNARKSSSAVTTQSRRQVAVDGDEDKKVGNLLAPAEEQQTKFSLGLSIN